jgi:hypothetical protein
MRPTCLDVIGTSSKRVPLICVSGRVVSIWALELTRAVLLFQNSNRKCFHSSLYIQVSVCKIFVKKKLHYVSVTASKLTPAWSSPLNGVVVFRVPFMFHTLL